MRSSLLEATLKARATAHFSGVRMRPVLIQGSPGVGKTQLAAELAAHLGVGFASLHAPLMLNEDFGMPRFNPDGELSFATHGHKFPFEDAEGWPDQGIFLVDEIPQADPDQQKIWANIFQERELHGRKLRRGWYFVSTGNRIADRAGANRILSHFNDRFTTYDFDVNLDDWCTWALGHTVRPEVVGFCRWRPDLLSKHDPSLEKSPTPRAWSEGVSPSIDVVPDDAMFDTIKGDVGEGAAAEFAGFLETYRALPNPDLIIKDPERSPVPDTPQVLYALSSALAHRATVDNFEQLAKYAVRIPPEFMVLLVRDAVKRSPEIENTKACVHLYTGPMAKVLYEGR